MKQKKEEGIGNLRFLMVVMLIGLMVVGGMGVVVGIPWRGGSDFSGPLPAPPSLADFIADANQYVQHHDRFDCYKVKDCSDKCDEATVPNYPVVVSNWLEEGEKPLENWIESARRDVLNSVSPSTMRFGNELDELLDQQNQWAGLRNERILKERYEGYWGLQRDERAKTESEQVLILESIPGRVDFFTAMRKDHARKVLEELGDCVKGKFHPLDDGVEDRVASSSAKPYSLFGGAWVALKAPFEGIKSFSNHMYAVKRENVESPFSSWTWGGHYPGGPGKLNRFLSSLGRNQPGSPGAVNWFIDGLGESGGSSGGPGAVNWFIDGLGEIPIGNSPRPQFGTPPYWPESSGSRNHAHPLRVLEDQMEGIAPGAEFVPQILPSDGFKMRIKH